MTNVKSWCWKPAENGNGPDWLLLAKVDPSSVEALAQRAATTTLEGYTTCADTHEYCPSHQQNCVFHSFIDTANAETYLGNLAGKEKRNIWVYNLVQIHGDLIMLECGYGGRGNLYNQVETAFLLSLFSTPAISLQSWEVLAGGEGYDYATIQAGIDVDSFIAYVKQGS